MDASQRKQMIRQAFDQEWWDVVWNAGYRGLLNQLSEDEQELFRQQHMDEIQQLCDAEQTWLDTGVNIAIARKLARLPF